MGFDTIIKGGTVIDGSGLPRRVADVGIRDGKITDIGHLSGAKEEIDADGLMVVPGLIDAHTHYDPQLTFEPFATSSCYHGVTSVVAGNCGYSIAPCRAEDHKFMIDLFAKVEGFSPNVLENGLPWDWDSFPSFLDVLDERLGINAAFYVGHSALRRFAMGDDASQREATADEIETMKGMIRSAMSSGAAGFSTSRAPTHVDQFKKPVPSRHASDAEVEELVRTTGEGGAGSISYLPASAVKGLDDEDKERLIRLGRACGLPIIVQGMGNRPGRDPEIWESQQRFLDDAAERGAAVFSIFRTQPFMRPFNWKRGTSLYDGVFHWRDLSGLPFAERLQRMKDPSFREKLRWGLDHPNTDGAQGSTLPPPDLRTVFVDRCKADPGAEGKSVAQLAEERNVHAADVICDLAAADELETQFVWNNESETWAAANAESQRNRHMILGTGDGGAHADRDDGAEWTTYFISDWLLKRRIFPLEDGIRRLTHIPAVLTGMTGRGLLARGYHADVTLFDPSRIRLGRKQIVRDMPGDEERWQVYPEGIHRVLVNGRTIVKDGQLSGERPGRVLRVGNATA